MLCWAILFAQPLHAQTALVLNGVKDRVIDGGTYSSVSISNSMNVTIRNATVTRSSVGEVVSIWASRAITIENSDIQGNGVACSGVNIGGNSGNVILRGNRIHNIADDGIQAHVAHDLLIEGNAIYTLVGIGTDSGGFCYNGHSDGIELFTIQNAQIRTNLIYDVRSTSALFFGNTAKGPAGYNRNILIENNIFSTPEAGFVAYLYQADGVKLYNNTMWWGTYGGLAMGDNVYNLEAVNNVFHSINYGHTKTPYLSGHHTFRNTLIGTTLGQATPSAILSSSGNFVQSDPRFANIPSIGESEAATSYRHGSGSNLRFSAADFMPFVTSPLVDRGLVAAGLPVVDFRGVSRPQGS
ncbi:right-handed parallel beta-helix repeat-containing protein, partial [Microvirga sp. 0TCS3.31]